MGPQRAERSPGSVPSFHRGGAEVQGREETPELPNVTQGVLYGAGAAPEEKMPIRNMNISSFFYRRGPRIPDRGVSYPKTPREVGAELGLVRSSSNLLIPHLGS